MTQASWPRPGKVLIGLLVANLVAYVIQLVLLRAGFGQFIGELVLVPGAVFDEGKVWQVVTYWWLHDPTNPFHLLGNMFWLYLFGAPLEKWWGPKRFLGAYCIFGLGGAALTLLLALASDTALLQPIMGGFWLKPHLGASGAVMGCTVAWGVLFWDQRMNFLFLGEMTGKTFVLISIGIELLTALSYSPVSSSSHFGGMAAAFVLCKGLWRPARVKELFRTLALKRQRRKIEAELRVIEGGKGDPDRPKKKSDWN